MKQVSKISSHPHARIHTYIYIYIYSRSLLTSLANKRLIRWEQKMTMRTKKFSWPNICTSIEYDRFLLNNSGSWVYDTIFFLDLQIVTYAHANLISTSFSLSFFFLSLSLSRFMFDDIYLHSSLFEYERESKVRRQNDYSTHTNNWPVRSHHRERTKERKTYISRRKTNWCASHLSQNNSSIQHPLNTSIMTIAGS